MLDVPSSQGTSSLHYTKLFLILGSELVDCLEICFYFLKIQNFTYMCISWVVGSLLLEPNVACYATRFLKSSGKCFFLCLMAEDNQMWHTFYPGSHENIYMQNGCYLLDSLNISLQKTVDYTELLSVNGCRCTIQTHSIESFAPFCAWKHFHNLTNLSSVFVLRAFINWGFTFEHSASNMMKYTKGG